MQQTASNRCCSAAVSTKEHIETPGGWVSSTLGYSDGAGAGADPRPVPGPSSLLGASVADQLDRSTSCASPSEDSDVDERRSFGDADDSANPVYASPPRSAALGHASAAHRLSATCAPNEREPDRDTAALHTIPETEHEIVGEITPSFNSLEAQNGQPLCRKTLAQINTQDYVVRAGPLPICTPLPAQLTIPGVQEEVRATGLQRESAGSSEPTVGPYQEVQLAYTSGMELAFIVLPPVLPGPGPSVSVARWYPTLSASAPRVQRVLHIRVERPEALAAIQHRRGVFCKCIFRMCSCLHECCCADLDVAKIATTFVLVIIVFFVLIAIRTHNQSKE